MENAMFYTYSTIPQVLAAIIAFLGAFIVYKKSLYNKLIEERALSILNLLKSNYRGDADLKSLIRAGRYSEFCNAIEAHFNRQIRAPKRIHLVGEEDYNTLVILLKRNKDLSNAFKGSVYLTIPLIFISILIIFLTPKILICESLPVGLFIFIFIWLIICLISYINIVMHSLK